MHLFRLCCILEILDLHVKLCGVVSVCKLKYILGTSTGQNKAGNKPSSTMYHAS